MVVVGVVVVYHEIGKPFMGKWQAEWPPTVVLAVVDVVVVVGVVVV